MEVKQKLIDIRSSNDEAAFLAQVREFPQRLDFGYNKPNPKLSDKDELLKTVAHHFIIPVNFEEIQLFKDGLASNGVLALLEKYSKLKTQKHCSPTTKVQLHLQL